MPRKKSPYIGKDNWKALTTWLSMVCDLDEGKFREGAARLADAIEREGLAVHRNADVLEGLSMFNSAWHGVNPAHHARSAIMSRLKRWHDEDKRYLRVAEGRLDQLAEVGARDQLRQQAAVLLDAAELIRTNLQWHEQRLEKLWPSKKGRPPSVASAIGSIKARCGGGVRNKLPVAQCNEVLAKVLLHNLACVVHAIEKYGIGVSFPLEAVKS